MTNSKFILLTVHAGLIVLFQRDRTRRLRNSAMTPAAIAVVPFDKKIFC